MPPRHCTIDPAIHDELLRLTRGVGALRLAIADGVERLAALGGIEALGFPNVEAYAREQLGRSGRWVGDARTLNRRLGRWPALKEAFLTGRLASSKVELLARHLSRSTTPEPTPDELEAKIAQAEASTVRALRAVLGDQEHSNPTEWVTLTRRVERVDAVGFEGAIRLMNALGETTRTAAIEGVLAEALSTLMNRSDLDPALVARIAGRHPAEPLEATHPTPPTHTDIGLPPQPPQPQAQPQTPPSIALPEDPASLDLDLRNLAAELTRRDLRIGQLAQSLARFLGTNCADAYYRDVLGLAPSSMAARIALARRAEHLPRLEAALESGTIGFESATLLARIATPDTEAAWLELAIISTTKIFREHVDAAELHARADGAPLHGLLPPSPTELETARDLERQVLAAAFESSAARVSPMSVPATMPDLGKVDLRLTLPDDLAAFWCDLELLHADAGSPTDTFVAFLAHTSLDTWRGHARLPAYGEIYLRDRFRCQNPVCRSRHVTPHHIIFRAHGGSEDPTNLLSLCDRCHLDLIHAGHLEVSGQAPNSLRWKLAADVPSR